MTITLGLVVEGVSLKETEAERSKIRRNFILSKSLDLINSGER